MSLPSTDTSDCFVMRNSPPLMITPSSRRIPQLPDLRTAQNSSTSVPPICRQYQYVIGVSSLLNSVKVVMGPGISDKPNAKRNRDGVGPSLFYFANPGKLLRLVWPPLRTRSSNLVPLLELFGCENG